MSIGTDSDKLEAALGASVEEDSTINQLFAERPEPSTATPLKIYNDESLSVECEEDPKLTDHIEMGKATEIPEENEEKKN